MTYVVVTADDYGLSPAVSAGIAESHRSGLVSNTTWMANFPESLGAAAELRDLPGLDVGIHLNLTAGSPLLPATSVRSLVDGRAQFRSLARLLGHAAVRGVRIDELRREWAAQIEAGLAAGLVFSSLTSHQHVHMHPLWFGVAAELAVTYGIPAIRRSRFRPLRAYVRSPSYMALEFCSAAVRVAQAVHSPAYLMTARDFVANLPRKGWCGDGLIEVISHPGYIDDLLRVRDPLLAPRLDDLSILTDSTVRAAVARSGIRITNFREWAARSPSDVSSPPYLGTR